MSWNKIVKGAMTKAKGAASKVADKGKSIRQSAKKSIGYANKPVFPGDTGIKVKNALVPTKEVPTRDIMKKFPYIPVGAGLVGAGLITDLLTANTEQEGEISPEQLEIAAQKLRELGYSEEDIAMYLEKATRHPSNFNPEDIDVTNGWATNNDADQEIARSMYSDKFNNNSLELLLQMQKNRNKGVE